ncbi:MAG TPA: fluoride efflux transporter CrcB [Planctomycetaceae bacterium]|nr:fluoride efflux transporter CrcB [Planctomycetaceae bacterium]
MTKVLWIALAGALGTLARYGLSKLVQESTESLFPWGTLAVNVLGCLVFGVLCSAMGERFAVSPQTRTILLVGFMGAFTTFSTFAFETGELIREGSWLLAAGNMTASNILGLTALLVGLALGRLI